MGVSSSVAAWLVARHDGPVRSVLEKQLERGPTLAENSGFLAAVDWLRRAEGEGRPLTRQRKALPRPRKSRDDARLEDIW